MDIAAEVRKAFAEDARRAAEYIGPSLPFAHNGNQREAAMPWLSHVEIAGRVRMLTRDDWTHEAVVCAARDRILHLAQENERLRAVVDAARLMPRRTPAAGGCSTEHNFKIEASTVWALDKALNELDGK